MPDGRGVAVVGVDPLGAAAAGGLRPGARLLTINGETVRDELDLAFLSAGKRLRVEFLHPDGHRARIRLSKRHDDEPLGIEIAPLRPRRCRNRCIFCFVDQNPPGLRPSLRLKDDDVRLSFTHGHYITLTSLRADDSERIARQRLSPLYVSVHASDHVLRCRMLGVAPARTRPVVEVLRQLGGQGIRFHTQVVLCPGWNDGAELDRTLQDLAALDEIILSVAVVPVGLTAHRRGLTPLRAVTPSVARAVLGQLAPVQERMLERRGGRWALAADELYLLAGETPPPYSHDEMNCQIENGVGMMAAFWKGWGGAERRLPERLDRSVRAVVLTGRLGARIMSPLAARLNRVEGLTLTIVALRNSLFGPSVTVSGLLAGRDFARGLRSSQTPQADIILLPANALRPDDERFLDDLTLSDLRGLRPQARIEAVNGGAAAIARRLLRAGRGRSQRIPS